MANTEPTTVARLVAARFGGLTAMARALGHTNPSTVQVWVKTGRIPPKHWPAIERAALDASMFDITARWLGEAHAAQEVRRANAAKKKPQNEEVA